MKVFSSTDIPESNTINGYEELRFLELNGIKQKAKFYLSDIRSVFIKKLKEHK